MSNNPPPYGPPGGGQPSYPQGGQPPYGPPGGSQPYGPPGGSQPYGPPSAPPPYGAPQSPGQPYGQPGYGSPYAPPGAGDFGAPYGQRPSKKWYQRWWVWLLIALAIIIIAIVIVAIVLRNKFALESKLKDVIQEQGHSAKDVSCPSDVNTDAGHSYTCSATIDGIKRQVTVDFVADRKFVITGVS